MQNFQVLLLYKYRTWLTSCLTYQGLNKIAAILLHNFDCFLLNENFWFSNKISQKYVPWGLIDHYSDIIMGVMASQITSLTIVYSTVYSGTDQRKHQSSTSLVFSRGIHWWLVNSPHKGPVTQKMFPCDEIIMNKPALILIMVCWQVLSGVGCLLWIQILIYILFQLLQWCMQYWWLSARLQQLHC